MSPLGRSWRLVVSLLVIALVAGCGGPTPPPTTGPGPGPSGAPGEGPTGTDTTPPLPAEAAAIFPGLYPTAGLAIHGDARSVTVVSLASCQELVTILDASDWSVAEDFPWPVAEGQGLAFNQRWLVLARGQERAFVRMAEGRGCSARVDVMSRQPVVARGVVAAEGEATAYPLNCARIEDDVLVAAMYEGPADFRASVSFGARAATGTTPLDPTFMEGAEFTVGRSSATLFATMAAGARDAEDDPPGFEELDLGSATGGTLTVDSVNPLSGTLDLTGLVTSDGREQALRLGFSCVMRTFGRPLEPPVAGPDSVTLTATLAETMRVALGDSEPLVEGTSAVTLEGTLTQGEPGRYTGSATATGSGDFDELDADDFQGRCSNSWTGTQTFTLSGIVSATTMTLSWEPAGSPAVEYEGPCNRTLHAEDKTFPNVEALEAGSDIKLTWPPGTPETNAQTVTVTQEGVATSTWTVTFR